MPSFRDLLFHRSYRYLERRRLHIVEPRVLQSKTKTLISTLEKKQTTYDTASKHSAAIYTYIPLHPSEYVPDYCASSPIQNLQATGRVTYHSICPSSRFNLGATRGVIHSGLLQYITYSRGLHSNLSHIESAGSLFHSVFDKVLFRFYSACSPASHLSVCWSVIIDEQDLAEFPCCRNPLDSFGPYLLTYRRRLSFKYITHPYNLYVVSNRPFYMRSEAASLNTDNNGQKRHMLHLILLQPARPYWI